MESWVGGAMGQEGQGSRGEHRLRISDWKDRRRSKHDEAGQGGKGVEALRRGARGDGERGSGCHHVLTRASRTASVQRLARTPGRVRDD
jgi:hypothetical protein